jgi:hypothetical protein
VIHLRGRQPPRTARRQRHHAPSQSAGARPPAPAGSRAGSPGPPPRRQGQGRARTGPHLSHSTSRSGRSLVPILAPHARVRLLSLDTGAGKGWIPASRPPEGRLVPRVQPRPRRRSPAQPCYGYAACSCNSTPQRRDSRASSGSGGAHTGRWAPSGSGGSGRICRARRPVGTGACRFGGVLGIMKV